MHGGRDGKVITSIKWRLQKRFRARARTGGMPMQFMIVPAAAAADSNHLALPTMVRRGQCKFASGVKNESECVWTAVADIPTSTQNLPLRPSYHCLKNCSRYSATCGRGFWFSKTCQKRWHHANDSVVTWYYYYLV